MDEFDELRRMRDDLPGPDAESKARARALLTNEIDSASSTGGQDKRRISRKLAAALAGISLLVALSISPAGPAVADQIERWVGLPGEDAPFSPLGDQPVAERDLERFSVLGTESVELGELPEPLLTEMAALTQEPEETDFRHGSVDLDIGEVGIAGTVDGICMTATTETVAGSSCSSTKSALSRPLHLPLGCQPDLEEGMLRILGLVPDGVGLVTLRALNPKNVKTLPRFSEDGPRYEAKVESNVYEVVVEPAIYAATGTDGDGYSFDTDVWAPELALAPASPGSIAPGKEICIPVPPH